MKKDIHQKKKIIFIINSINFMISHRLDLFKRLKKEGFEVLIISGNEKIKKEYSNLINKNDYHLINLKASEQNPLRIIAAIYSVIKILKKYNTSIVHTVSPMGNLIGGLSSLLFTKIFLITAISGKGTLYVSNKIPTKIIKFFFSISEFLYLNKKNSATITQNSDDYNEIKSKQIKTKENIIIKGSGVDLTKFKFNSSIKKYDFCFVGRLTAEKGIFDFIEAASLIHKKNKNIKFLVVGDVPLDNKKTNEELDTHYKEKKYITFVGFQTKLQDYYNESKILCLPSKREGMPRVILEASACGVPSIAYDVTGCNEAIRNGVNGFLVKNIDPVDLSVTMIEVLKKKNLDDLGQKSRAYAEKYFSIESVIDKHINLYNKIQS